MPHWLFLSSSLVRCASQGGNVDQVHLAGWQGAEVCPWLKYLQCPVTPHISRRYQYLHVLSDAVAWSLLLLRASSGVLGYLYVCSDRVI